MALFVIHFLEILIFTIGGQSRRWFQFPPQLEKMPGVASH